MEKLVSRSSGGGAKLGTLDMQSYLEVMGRQLDEIQAQHQQFTASRQDRLGRLRSQDHPVHLVKRWSSDSHGPLPQPGGTLPEYPAPLGDYHLLADPPPPGAQVGGNGGETVRSASTSQNGARRSLLFPDDPLTGVGSHALASWSAMAAPSEPPFADALAATAQPQMSPIGSAQQDSESPSVSASMSTAQSVMPSTASARARSDTPGTPSTYTTQRAAMPPGDSRLGTASSSRTSVRRPYVMYDASGVGSVPYTTPDSHDGDIPLTASISSSSKSAWQAACIVASSPSPSPIWSEPDAAATSRSTPGNDTPQSKEHDMGVDREAASKEDDISPYTLALPGRPFDGIDSEEDEEVVEKEAAGEPRSAGLRGARGSAYGCAAGSAHGGGGASAGSPPRALQLGVDPNQQGIPEVASQPCSSGSSDARPLSRSGARVPLVAASLETEEALRALLATPRFAMGRGGAVGASMDVEGLEVPDDVLAALAATDGMDLDAALGAAMVASLREQHAQQSGTPSGRAGAHIQGGGGLAGTGQGRHVLLGPGALTAAPLAVAAAGAGRGFDSSSTGGANARPIGGTAAASPRAVARRDISLQQQHTDRSPLPVDASIEMDSMDVLSRTLEVSADDGVFCGAGLRDSAAFAKVAMAAQVAAAQQHSQPVLYSLAPKPSPPTDRGSRRSTFDGDGKRSTLDGGSRRNTVDGGSKRATADSGSAALQEGLEQGPTSGLQLQQHGTAASVTISTPTESGTAGRPDTKLASASLSAAVSMAGHTGALNPAGGRAAEGSAAGTSPLRVLPSGATALSPSASSSVMRQAGDVDMVLYGSPSHKADSGASASVPLSPNVQLPPQAGADQSVGASSQSVPHLGSRLQRNSRKMDEQAVAGVHREACTDSGQAAEDDTGAAAGRTGPGLRPWSAVSTAQSSSRRHLAPAGVLGSSSATNSLQLDLSLTQAAAAVAGTGRSGFSGPQPPSSGSASAGPSPAVSQRHLRTHGAQHLPALHKQPPEQQLGTAEQEASQQPAYSTFSLEALSPSGRPVFQVSSYDLGVDDVGRPLPQLPSPNSLAGAGASSLGADSARNSRSQVMPTGPPLAAFSRAAALAAAADVGMAEPPPAMERRSVGTRASAAAQDSGTVTSTAGVGYLRAHGAADASEHAGPEPFAAQQHELPKEGVAAASLRYAGDDRCADAEHPESVYEQSAGLPPFGSGAAKLSQLKARRQQQWQSQHGLQGGQPQLAVASAASPQQPVRHLHEAQAQEANSDQRSRPPGSSAEGHIDNSASYGWGGGAATRPAPKISAGAEATNVGSRSPLAAAATSPLLPDAVAEAIARAACSTEASAVSGEINLGHGISGLSVAIEAGQVKWAWQTEEKGKPCPRQLAVPADAAPSPGPESHSSSPWASPAVANAAVRDSGSEWALGQLPAPQWQRYGQMPAGAHAQQQEESQRQLAHKKAPVIHQQVQPSGHYADARRRSEYSAAERQTANADSGALQHYAVSAGGFMPQGQHQLRVGSATDGGGQPNPKAMALLRLKQQSIMRHNLQASSVKGSDGQSEIAPQPALQAGSRLEPYQRSRASSAGAQQVAQQGAPPRQVSAPRVTHNDGQGDLRQYPVRMWPDESTAQGDGEAAGPQAQPKPFLKRRSSKVQARKVDWSHVKPRTNSRNPDYYYGDQNSPDATLKGRISPLTSPRGGVSKPPLNVNVGLRAKKAGAKFPLTPTHEDKAPSGQPARRRMSNIPPAPVSYAPATSAGGAATESRGAGVGPKRMTAGGLSPLDDLLAHVNTLLRDFDKMEL